MEARPQALLLLHDETPNQRPRRRTNLPSLPFPRSLHPRQKGKPRTRRARAVGPRSTVSEGSLKKLVVVRLVRRPAGARSTGRGSVGIVVAVVDGALVKVATACVVCAVTVIIRFHLFDKGQNVHLVGMFSAAGRGPGTAEVGNSHFFCRCAYIQNITFLLLQTHFHSISKYFVPGVHCYRG